MLIASSILSHFFDRLFRYRQTEARRPLEDFLTELLADLLARAPKATALQLIQECFIPKSLASEFRALVGDRRLAVSTQVRMPSNKILDLLIEMDDRPLIVVENKIGAAFQMHPRPPKEAEESDEAREVERDHQLITYGAWLRNAPKPEGWPGVLAVLTHTALAPQDFQPSGMSRYGAVPHQCSWRSFHGHLYKLVADDEPVIPVWKFIGREICNFLESNDMASSDLTSVDIAAMNISMEVGRRGPASFLEVSAELLHRHPDVFVRKGLGNEIFYEHSRMWGWTYFSGRGKIYLGCGIFFAPLVGHPASATPPLPDHEHAFIAVGSDDTGLRMEGFKIPDGWSRLPGDYLIAKPILLSERRSGERFPQFLLRMIENEFATVTVLRDAYQRSLTPEG
jgi:hypothetical protein